MKKRIEWIDLIKFICIFFVIVDHTDNCPRWIINLFSPFFLNCFFFVSGYCYNHEASFKLHINKKFRQLFIPWFLFSNINILASHIYTYYGHDDLKVELLKNLLQIRGFGDYLWFIACLFVAYIPFYSIIKYDKKSNKTLKVLILLLLLSYICSVTREYMDINNIKHIWGKTNFLWHGEYICEAMMYMFAGYSCKKYNISRFDYLITNMNITIVFVIYIISLCIKGYLPYSYFTYFLYNTITGIIGVIFITMISKKLKPNKYTMFVGSNTLVYFSFHNKVKTFIYFGIERLFPSFVEMIKSNLVLSSVYTIVIAYIVTIALVPIATIINRYFPWMIGRKKQINT